MKKKRLIHHARLLLGGCFTALSLTACSSDNDGAAAESSVAIATLEGKISDAQPVTRTHLYNGEDNLEGGDVTGSDLKTVFDVGDLIYASLSYEHDGQVHPYYFMGGNTFVSTNSPLIFNKDASPSQHLIAFYRGDLKRRLNHGLTFEVPQDQSTEQKHQSGEFIYGHAALTQANVDANNFPTLTFYHKTARIILRIQCPSGTGYDVAKISKVEIGNGQIFRRGTVKLDESTGDATINVLNAASSSTYSGTNSGYITAYRRIKSQPTSGDHSEMWASIVFPPQSLAATSNFFKVTYDAGGSANPDGKVYYFHLLKDASFTDSNKKPYLENHAYYYTVTVGDHSARQK